MSIARGATPNVAARDGSRLRKDQQVRLADQVKAIEMLLDRGFGRSPQQLDIAHTVTERPLEHPSDEALRLLVKNAQQLKEDSDMAIDGDENVLRSGFIILGAIGTCVTIVTGISGMTALFG